MANASNECASKANGWDNIREIARKDRLLRSLELPPPQATSIGRISEDGWIVFWRTGLLRGKPYLDVYSSHRMTNSSHRRIHASGRVAQLPVESEWIVYPEGCTEKQGAEISRRKRRYWERVNRLIDLKFWGAKPEKHGKT